MLTYHDKPSNDNSGLHAAAGYDAEEQNRRYYESRHKRNTECATMAWALAGFALFCMIIGAVVMKIAMEI